jgi:methyltransferase (TIGR00027 family)
MEEERPSATAIANAMTRAAHLLLDDDPKIFADTLALRLSGVGDEAALRANLNTLVEEIARSSTLDFAQALFREFRALQALRSRYTEDKLEKALQQGISQYVILGAGLDSFAYRRQDLSGGVRVFELDYPATQHWKRERLRELHIALPSNLTFIPIDFEKQTLAEALQAGGYRPEEPAFFSWLGVTRYLTEETVFKTLRAVAAMSAPGSVLVLDYSLPDSLLDEEGRRFLAVLRAFGTAHGEPWQSLFEPATLAARVKEAGFAEVWDFGPEQANTRYFAGRTDGLRVPQVARLMRARVGKVL